MAKMVPTVGIVVIRDGKRVRPTIGKAFDFTKEEIADLKEAHPTALRKSSNEDDGESTATPSAAVSQAKARGGKKAATANKSDAEVAEEGTEGTDPPEGEAVEGAGTDDDL